MNKFAALALAATALSALPGAAQSQTARPAATAAATPAAQKPVQIDDLSCVVRTSLQKQLSKAEAEDTKATPERRQQAERIVVAADRALAYFLGRVSMGANDPYRSQRGEAIFNALKKAPRQQVGLETAACLNHADTQLRSVLSTFKSAK